MPLNITWNSGNRLSNFAQWHYRSKWGLTDARLLLIENLYQYPARQPEISWLAEQFFLVLHWTHVLQETLMRITSDFIVRVENARSLLNDIKRKRTLYIESSSSIFSTQGGNNIEFSWEMNLKIISTENVLNTTDNVYLNHDFVWFPMYCLAMAMLELI